MHSLVHLSATDTLVSFGGWTPDDGPVNETLLWERVSVERMPSSGPGWVSLQDATFRHASPRARYGHTAVALDAQRMLVLGGMEFGGYQGDLGDGPFVLTVTPVSAAPTVPPVAVVAGPGAPAAGNVTVTSTGPAAAMPATASPYLFVHGGRGDDGAQVRQRLRLEWSAPVTNGVRFVSRGFHASCFVPADMVNPVILTLRPFSEESNDFVDLDPVSFVPFSSSSVSSFASPSLIATSLSSLSSAATPAPSSLSSFVPPLSRVRSTVATLPFQSSSPSVGELNVATATAATNHTTGPVYFPFLSSGGGPAQPSAAATASLAQFTAPFMSTHWHLSSILSSPATNPSSRSNSRARGRTNSLAGSTSAPKAAGTADINHPGYVFVLGGNHDNRPILALQALDLRTWTWYNVDVANRELYESFYATAVFGTVSWYHALVRVILICFQCSRCCPRPRNSCSLTLVGDQLVLIGGSNGSFMLPSSGRDLGDVFRFDLMTGLWQEVRLTGLRSMSNFGRLHSATRLGPETILLAFGSRDRRITNDITVLNPFTGVCHVPVVSGMMGRPRERSTQAMIRLPGSDQFIMYGGMNMGPLADTWLLTICYASEHSGLPGRQPSRSASGLLLFRAVQYLFSCCRLNAADL
jgi:hypothetical protein